MCILPVVTKLCVCLTIIIFSEMAEFNLNWQDEEGRTILFHCCVIGLVEFVKQLLMDPRVNVNLADNAGDTPLHAAATSCHPAVVRELVRHPVIDMNATNKRGETPLKKAIDGYVQCACNHCRTMAEDMKHNLLAVKK